MISQSFGVGKELYEEKCSLSSQNIELFTRPSKQGREQFCVCFGFVLFFSFICFFCFLTKRKRL